MIRIMSGADLRSEPRIADEMFIERRRQFRDRYGWALEVDEAGRERDEYDDMNPLYVIVTDEEDRHVASARLMPTTGPNMAADHFRHLTDGVAISSSTVWEVTRFFVSNRADRRAAAAVMWAGCALARSAGVQFYLGVIDASMTRVFAAAGASPEIIGRGRSAEGEILACLWENDDELFRRLQLRSGRHATEALSGARRLRLPALADFARPAAPLTRPEPRAGLRVPAVSPALQPAT